MQASYAATVFPFSLTLHLSYDLLPTFFSFTLFYYILKVLFEKVHYLVVVIGQCVPCYIIPQQGHLGALRAPRTHHRLRRWCLPLAPSARVLPFCVIPDGSVKKESSERSICGSQYTVSLA